MKIKCKKGGAIAEASLIYPLIFLTMITVICIIISMYMASVAKAGLNIELKEKNLTDNKIGSFEFSNSTALVQDKYSKQVFMYGDTIKRRQSGTETVLEGIRAKQYRSYGIAFSTKKRSHYSVLYDIDEKKYIRKLDMVIK